MPPWFHSTDLWLLHKINGEWVNPLLDRIFPTVTDFVAWAPVFALIAAVALLFGGTRMRLLCVAIGIGVLIGDVIVSASIKGQTNRKRPRDSVAEVVVRDLPETHPRLLAVFQAPVERSARLALPSARGRSFPSSHTVNMFALATVCWMAFGRRTWWVGGIAALVAWSRVYCGAHWPSDVLAGIPIGIVCGNAAVGLTDWLWTRAGDRFFPQARRAVPALRMRRGVERAAAG